MLVGSLAELAVSIRTALTIQEAFVEWSPSRVGGV